MVALFTFAGGALILQIDAWREITVAAAAVSLLLVALFPEAILNAPPGGALKRPGEVDAG